MKLETFDFESQAVRVVNREGAPWFVASDVCRVLELTNVTESTRTLDGDELDSEILNSGVQGRKTVLISESGLYALIFKSRKAQARKFRKWVTAEVLPAIRASGRFEVPTGKGCELVPVEVMSVLGFVRLHCAHLPIKGQMEFGLLVRRYAKAMGVIFQPVMEPGIGRVFGFSKALMEGLLAKMPQRLPLVADGEQHEMQVLLEAVERRMGLGRIAADAVRHVAKQMGLFAWVWKLRSAPAVNSAFGRVVRRMEGRLFENGLSVRCHRNGERRMYEVMRAPQPGTVNRERGTAEGE